MRPTGVEVAHVALAEVQFPSAMGTTTQLFTPSTLSTSSHGVQAWLGQGQAPIWSSHPAGQALHARPLTLPATENLVDAGHGVQDLAAMDGP
jgi:hypothetical protein